MPSRAIRTPFCSKNGLFGELEYYDEEYERVSVKKPRSLQRLDKRMFFYVATCDDEVSIQFIRLFIIINFPNFLLHRVTISPESTQNL